jgi:peptide/nickel transport system substrate-binding protein
VPVTVADVAYDLKLIREMGTTYPGYGAGGMPAIIKTFKQIDPTHFEVVLTHKVNPQWFIYNGLNQLGPIPEHAWSHYTLDQLWQEQSFPSFYKVIDGPLQVSKFDVGQDVVFVPNPSYPGPKMHFSRLVMKFVESAGAELEGAQSGDLDFAFLPDSLREAAKNLPGIYDVDLGAADSWNYVDINFRNPNTPFFKDVRVRQAMEDAINQQAIIDLVYHGTGQTMYGPVPEDAQDFLSPAMRAGHYPVGYDPAKSIALLKSAGYMPGPDGIMRKDGKPIAFNFLMQTGDSSVEQMTDIIQSDLHAVGIEMKVREIEFNQEIALLDSASDTSWETAGLGLSIGGYPSGEDEFETGSYGDDGGYSDKKMDALIDASVDTPGLAGLYAWEDYTAAQVPVLFLPVDDNILLVRDRLRGLNDFISPLGALSPDQLYCRTGAPSA